MEIVNPGLKFKPGMPKLNLEEVKYLIQHHEAGNQGYEGVHNMHLDRGWYGGAYNFYIPKDGSIVEMRGLENRGGHTKNYNSISLGICYQGDFTVEKMTDEQLEAGIEFNYYLLNKLPELHYMDIVGHSDFTATLCPGGNFRMAELRKGVKSKFNDAEDWRILQMKKQIETLADENLLDSKDFWLERVAKLEEESMVQFEFHMLHLTVLARQAKII